MAEAEKKIEELLTELQKLSGLKLLVSSGSEGEAEDQLPRLEALVETLRHSGSRETLLQALITGDLSPEDFFLKASRFHIDLHAPRVLYYLKTQIPADAAMIRFLKHALADRQGLLFLSAGEHSLILLETRKGKSKETEKETAGTIVSLLNTEMFTGAKVAISRIVPEADGLPAAFREAVRTMEAGSLFDPGKNVYAAGEPGEALLIYSLSKEDCAAYLKDALPGVSERYINGSPEELSSFSGDILNTAECFLRNDLNIAETARQLHMHRNTLLYRIEQIRQETGLDIRRFDDAMRYRLCGMVQKLLMK